MSDGKFSVSFIFLRVILALLECIIVHMNFTFDSSSSINLCAVFGEFVLNLSVNLKRRHIFIMLTLPIYEYGMSLRFLMKSFKSFDNISDVPTNDFLPFYYNSFIYFGAKSEWDRLAKCMSRNMQPKYIFFISYTPSCMLLLGQLDARTLCCWTKIRPWALFQSLLRSILLGTSLLVTMSGKLVETLISRLADEA